MASNGSDSSSDRTDEAHSLLNNLETQAAALLRRVQRLQGRQCQRHLHKQMQSFVRREQAASGLGCQMRKLAPADTPAPVHSNGRIQHKSAAEQIRMLDRNGVRSMPTSALVDIVRNWENQNYASSDSFSCLQSASAQTAGQRLTQCSSGISKSNISNDVIGEHVGTNGQNSAGLVKLLHSPASADPSPLKQPNDRLEADGIERAAGQMKANVEHLEQVYDSEATDSSSGDESCDELSVVCDTSHPSGHFSSPMCSKKQSLASLRDSMTWTWAVQRGAIACRWMWLIAQVADLEFKIRQQNEMHRSLRLAKGQITLENTCCEPTDGPAGTEITQCVRTMPLRSLKKRQLVRANTALAGAKRKAARYSSVPCSCSSLPQFVSPCVLCNGRYGYVQVIDTDSMPQSERIAILDPACHPVLSLPTQVPLGLHFSKLLKKETVQKSALVRKVSKHPCRRKNNEPSPESPGSRYVKDIRRTNNNHKKSQALISSSKLRKKYDSKRKHTHGYDFSSSGKRSKSGRERHDSSSNGSNESSRQDSPVQSPIPIEHNSAPRRRRSEYAYDINNIVIPYSIASTTRVEKLQYKEILTPKWRVVDLNSERTEPVQSEDEDLEDLSDAIFNERHMRCELEEKKRFLTFLTPNAAPPGSGPKRARAARVRCDSKGDGLTPTALSGNNGFGNHTEDGNSQDSEISNHNTSNNSLNSKDTGAAKDQDSLVHGTPARAFERRRTTSSSRTRDDSVDEDHNVPDVQPFEKRKFPLEKAEEEDLAADPADEPAEMNGKHEEGRESSIEPVTPQTKSALNHHTDHSVTARNSATQPHVYASSSGETDQDEEDPEWEPKE